MQSGLPDVWVDRIFQRLTVRYGQAFLGRWAGVDMADVKADWADQLKRFANRPDCIKYALDNLPQDKAPNVGEFRALCNAAPEPEVLKLPEPKADPAKVAEVVAGMRKTEHIDHKAWAHSLRAREKAGDKLGVCQRLFWREALGVAPGDPA